MPEVIVGGVDDVDDEMPSPQNGAPPKRQVRRKPFWLAIPVEYVEYAVGDQVVREPRFYELYECRAKSDLERVLNKMKLDTTNLDPKDVKLFRADPIPVTLGKQVTLKF